MAKIDINFTRLFSAILQTATIELLAVPTSAKEQDGNGLLEALDRGFVLSEVICVMPAGIDSRGDISIKKTSYMVFGTRENIKSIKEKGEVFYINDRPEAVLMFWRIRGIKAIHGTFYVFRDIRPIDSNIIKIEGYK